MGPPEARSSGLTAAGRQVTGHACVQRAFREIVRVERLDLALCTFAEGSRPFPAVMNYVGYGTDQGHGAVTGRNLVKRK